MRCLWVSGDVPHPPTHGKFVYSAGLSEALAGAGVEVVGVGLEHPSDRSDPATLVSWHAVAASRRGRLASIPSRLPSMAFATTPLRDSVRALLAGGHWDAVVIDHLETGWVADLVPARRATDRVHRAQPREQRAAGSRAREPRSPRSTRRVAAGGREGTALGTAARRARRARRGDHRLGRRAVRGGRTGRFDHRADTRVSGCLASTRARSAKGRRVRRPSSRASTGM